ncbi:MAG: response regulator [Caldithrix sp.]|nr:MAG: response regulator [Caldithrix sp.]
MIDADKTQASPPRVLLVDDEQMVLDSLSNFLRLETDYDVFTYDSPTRALSMLRDESVDLVVSDFLMPGMDGLEFLAEVKRMYPETPRILLTGYADKENAIKGINEVGLYQYIEKPWDNDQIKLIIHNGLAQKTLKEALNKKIHELDSVLLQRDTLAQNQELLKKEMELARQLQQKILPDCFPDSNGLSFVTKYQPALEIGGDFYDILSLADGRYALLVADVTGHGIQAAMSTTLLKFVFSNFKGRHTCAGEIITGMNQGLYQILPSGMFVAALVATIDPETAECSIVNAGLPRPYFLRKKSQSVESIFSDGLLLGIVDNDAYQPSEELKVRLEPGDRLVFFTDGLTEVENSNEEQFDDGFLKKVLTQNQGKTAERIIDHLMVSAKEFSRPDYTWDDVTILAIEKA